MRRRSELCRAAPGLAVAALLLPLPLALAPPSLRQAPAPVVATGRTTTLHGPVPSTAVWHVSRSPKLRARVASGCPRTVAAAQDVVNTYKGPPLVPAGPMAGLICRYYGEPHLGHLGRQTRLDAARAARLANVVRRLNLAPPALGAHGPQAGEPAGEAAGAAACPLDVGSFAVIGLSYKGRPDVGLWYHTSGCETLDNGYIGASETGNPSFYNGFEGTINQLSPPLAMGVGG